MCIRDSFNPGELTPVRRKVYAAAHDGVKLYYSDEWFWTLKRSHYADDMRGVDELYDVWDKTGDYYALYDSHVPHHVTTKMNRFLEEIKKWVMKWEMGDEMRNEWWIEKWVTTFFLKYPTF